jgi:DNA-binding beta-propeller fold protein YncE
VATAFPRVFVAVPDRDEILGLDWPNWGFTDTLRIGPGPRYIAAHESGGVLYAVVEAQPALVRINAATSQETNRLPLNHTPVGLALSPDGTRAFALGDDGVLLVVKTASMSVIDSITVPAAADLSVHPTAPRLFLAAPDSALVWVVRTDTLGIESRWPVSGTPRTSQPLPARDELYVGTDEGGLDVLALSTGTWLRSIAIGESVRSLGVRGDSPDVRLYAISPSGTIYSVNPSSASATCTIAAGGVPGAIMRLGDGSVLLVVNAAGWADFLGFGGC